MLSYSLKEICNRFYLSEEQKEENAILQEKRMVKRKTLIEKDFFGEEIDVDVSRIFPVVVVATMSSGKSTLINALLGEDILPSKNQACTAKVFSVLDDDKAESMKLYVTRENGKVSVLESEIAQELEKANQDNSVKEILISGQIKGLQNTDKAVLLIDTPGPNNSGDISHGKTTKKVFDMLNGGIVLYLLNVTQLAIVDDLNLLSFVKEQVAKKENMEILFVLNKIDELDLEKESLIDVLLQAKGYLQENGIEHPQIIPVSALAAKVLKKMQKGERLTRKEQRDFEGLYERFKSEDFRLGPYAELLEQIETVEDAGNLGQLYLKMHIDNAIDNTGITYLEKQIQYYQILSTVQNSFAIQMKSEVE